MSPTYVLGVNAYDHDTSACLLADGVPIVAISKERLTRRKHDGGWYGDPVAYCLWAAGITLTQVDLVVRNCYVLPVGEMERRLAREVVPRYLAGAERERARRSLLFGAGPPRVLDVSHHLAHAWSAAGAAPFDECAVLVMDGVGSHRQDVTEPVPAACEAPPTARESESLYHYDGRDLRPLRKVWLPPARGFLSEEFQAMEGLGALYSRVSTYVFGDWNRCGEVMGLAPFGRPTLPPLAWVRDGEVGFAPWPDALTNPFDGPDDAAWEASPHRAEWEDLAWRVQHDAEEVILARAREAAERSGSRRLAFAGGVALNCVANGRLLLEGPFEELFVQPAAGDDGVALGAALYGERVRRGRPRRWHMEHAFLGVSYPPERVTEALGGLGTRLALRRERPGDLAEAVAARLAQGEVVGWFMGGSEFGPRALGHRSILADPRAAAVRDRVNARVKHRQAFRPFAPVVLAEHAREWFELEVESPYMLLAARVRPERAARLAAVTHVDGSARVQTLRRAQNPALYALIEAFARRTGVPVLLNTSLNDRGEPLVETPRDAVDCFLGTDLDALAIEGWVLSKRGAWRAVRGALGRARRARALLSLAAWRRRAARAVERRLAAEQGPSSPPGA